MHHNLIASTLLAAGGVVSAAAISIPAIPLAPALPLSAFNTSVHHMITLEEALAGVTRPIVDAIADLANDITDSTESTESTETTESTESTNEAANFRVSTLSVADTSAAAATCTNPRVRVEWDNMSDTDRQGFVTAIKCLIGKPASGQFSQAKNRYEDLVSLHQELTPNVHNNAKFLVWHRYYLWTFEDILRTECGMTGPLPWFDETKYAGRFAQSTIFNSNWFGAIALGGQCVTDGQFAGLTLNVGPGTGNTPHCLARNGDGSLTANTGSAMVNACNSRTTYSDMEYCSEYGPHAYGHNGVGAVMADVYASPSDPVFWLHHAFIDRNYRIWQNADSSRIANIDGTDRYGNALTLQTSVSVNGLRPNVVIGDIIDTLSTTLCYKYNY